MEANVNTTDIEIPQTMTLDNPPEEKEEITPFKDEVRESIFAKRRAMLEEEVAAQEPEAVPIQQPDPVEPEPQPVKEVEKEPEAIAAKEEAKKFILNVYGETRELTEEQMIREAQKGLASTQTFQEAKMMRDEALQIANLAKQNLQPVRQQAEQEKAPQPKVFDKERAKDIAKRFNYSSEDEQADALLELGASIEANVRGQGQSLPPEQLINIATQNAVAFMKNEREQEILKNEFSDILSDVPLSHATDIIANQIAAKYQQEGKQVSRLELFREAGNMAREKYLKPSAQPATPVQAASVNVSNDKIERKRAAPKPPAAVNKVSAEPPPQYGVGVNSIVNQMRKARGQPVYQ